MYLDAWQNVTQYNYVLKSWQYKNVDILFLLLTFQIYVVSSIMMYALPIFFNGYTMKVLVYILPHMIYVIHMALLGSIYSTVALAVERFIAVCYPFLKYRLINDKM